jgi:hypothetical protein
MFFNIRSDWGIIVLWYVLETHQPPSSEVQDKVAFIINNIFFNKYCVPLQVVLLSSELIESSSDRVVNCQKSMELVGEVDNWA